MSIKVKILSLLTFISLLPGCGAYDFPMTVGAIGAAAVTNSAAKMANKVAEGMMKGLTCSFAYSETIQLSDINADIEFYNDILNIAQEKNSYVQNLLNHIGPEREARLKNLIQEAYELRKKKLDYSQQDYLDLTIKALVHISKTPGSENKIWFYSKTIIKQKYDAKKKKNIKYGEQISVIIPLKSTSDYKKEDIKSYNDCQ